MLDVGIEGEGDGWLHVSNPLGPVLEVDDSYAGVEYGSVELLIGGIHFLQIEMASGDSSAFRVASNVRLKPLDDLDDGQTIQIGDSIAGSLDYLSDWDWYSIQLDEGQTVRITTESLNVNTIVYVDFPRSRDNQVVWNDDGLVGSFGADAELVYRAPHSGEYFVVVNDPAGDSVGGYYLSIERARDGTETVYVPPSPQIVDSEFSPMLVFEDPLGYFSVQVPESWLENELDPSQYEIFSAFDPETNGEVLIVEEDVLYLGLGELSLEEYAELIESLVLIPSGAEDVARHMVQLSQGLPAIRLEMSYPGYRLVRLIYMSDDNVAFNITYSFPVDEFDRGKRLADYSFDSFHVN